MVNKFVFLIDMYVILRENFFFFFNFCDRVGVVVGNLVFFFLYLVDWMNLRVERMYNK